MFRQIADEEMCVVEEHIKRVQYARSTQDFVQEIWGDEARQILVLTYWDTIERRVRMVEVTGEEAASILPDFSLPFWQKVFLYNPDFFDDCVTFMQKLVRVMEYLEENGWYRNYAFDPDSDGKVVTLSELVVQTEYPELYRREG